MKRGIVTLIILMQFQLITYGQSKYDTMMKKTFEEMKMVDSASQYLAIANTFDRIGKVEKDKGLPYYYAAYCYILMTHSHKGLDVDNYLDLAEQQLAKALGSDIPEVEKLVLQGYIHMMRVTVDPASRGQEYSMKSVEYLQRANSIDSENPRALLLLGQMQYGTAQFFGTSSDESCKTFNKVQTLYDKEKGTEKGLLPRWREGQAKAMIKRCNSSQNKN